VNRKAKIIEIKAASILTIQPDVGKFAHRL